MQIRRRTVRAHELPEPASHAGPRITARARFLRYLEHARAIVSQIGWVLLVAALALLMAIAAKVMWP